MGGRRWRDIVIGALDWWKDVREVTDQGGMRRSDGKIHHTCACAQVSLEAAARLGGSCHAKC